MVRIFTDGAAMGNPGRAAIGIVIKDAEKNQNLQYSHYIHIKDTHQAEFIAIIFALKLAKKYRFTSVILHSDSQIVVDSIEKKYIKHSLYLPLLNAILSLTQSFDLFFIKWIARKDNKNADMLAKQALQNNIYNSEIQQLDVEYYSK